MVAVDYERLEGLNSMLRGLQTKIEVQYQSLIVSIDLGTSYSGVAYIFTSNPDQIHIVNRWPSVFQFETADKVPTVLKYEPNQPNGFSWGFQVGRIDDKKIEAFKVLLDASLPIPHYVPLAKVNKTMIEVKKTPTDAVQDFMSALCQHALTAIEEAYPQEFLQVLDIKYVISLPVGWPENAVQVIVQAARNAGVSPIIKITEPEAAAWFTIQSDAAKGVDLKVRDAILVCDAGGGKVDLISYEIKKLKPLELIELVPPTVVRAGSLDLDRAFENHIKSALSDEEEFFPLRRKPCFVAALKQFDLEIKPNFTSGDTKTYNVRFTGANLTDERTGKLKNNVMTFDSGDLERIFQPVADTVGKSVSEQIDKVKVKRVNANRQDTTSVKAIFLVGGFGANHYLRARLGSKFPNVKIIQPSNAWTAVIRGSALRHAPPKKLSSNPPGPRVGSGSFFGSRKATKHYGILCSPIWNELEHKNHTKYWDSWEGVWRCKTINWIIQKNESLSKTRRITIPFSKHCPQSPDDTDMAIKATIVQSKSISAPINPDDASIRPNCTLKVSFQSIPEYRFVEKKRESDKSVYWELFYELVVGIQAGSVSTWIAIGDMELGKKTLT